MTDTLATLSPQDAWKTLPANQWNEAAARHLLQRVGFSATPVELAKTLREGPAGALRRYFAGMPALPKPRQIADLEGDTPDMARRIIGGDPTQRRLAVQDARERSREALLDLTIKWLQLAARPENAPAEKWLFFLSDVWVVGVQKVRNSALIYQHQDLLRQSALGRAADLAKAMSRSPAMVVYLDLQQSRRDAPNENFARELFELFTLGEGNYTENDIKQAARAFTGYRQRLGKFIYVPRQHDDGTKTVFGHKGRHTGDDVIDLVFKQKAAGTFLPREMIRFYLSDTPLPPAYTDALGAAWARTGHNLRDLLVTFFSSRVFFAEDFRGNFIKSPVHYYLGLLQDLDLSVAPIPRQVIGMLRQMGQMPFDPPNVRGWVGGRNWINSATLAARRQLVNVLLSPLNEDALNGDEQIELAAAYAEGISNFTLAPSQLAAWAGLPPAERARELVRRYAPAGSDTAIEGHFADYFDRAASSARSEASTRAALATLLESPRYQLC